MTDFEFDKYFKQHARFGSYIVSDEILSQFYRGLHLKRRERTEIGIGTYFCFKTNVANQAEEEENSRNLEKHIHIHYSKDRLLVSTNIAPEENTFEVINWPTDGFLLLLNAKLRY